MEVKGAGSGRVRTAWALGVAAIVVVALFRLRSVLLLAFLALLLGILFDAMAAWGIRSLLMRRGIAVVLAALVFVLGIGAAAALVTVPLIQQATDLAQGLPAKLQRVEHWATRKEQQYPWLRHFLPEFDQAPKAGKQESPPELAKKALFTLSTVLEWAAEALAVFFLGLFLAWDPERWLRGLTELWPGSGDAERIAWAKRVGSGLRSYLFTLLIYMVLMGVAWAVGLWLIGVQDPLLFGAIGGLAEVVPYIGPLLACIPPLLMATTEGMNKVLFVLALYAILHVVEGYLLVPYLMHQKEHLPPPLMILSILVCGTLFGLLGVLLAVPLATAAYVLTCLWLEKKKSREARLALPSDL